MLLWVEQAGASAEPGHLSLWLPSFSNHSPSHVSGGYPTLRVLTVLNPYISSLGKHLAPNLFGYNNAHRMLGDTVDSPSFAVGTFVGGHSFLNSAHSLDVYNIIFL